MNRDWFLMQMTQLLSQHTLRKMPLYITLQPSTSTHFLLTIFMGIMGQQKTYSTIPSLAILSNPYQFLLLQDPTGFLSLIIQLGTGFKVAPTTRDGPHLCYTIRCMSLPPLHSQFFMNPPPVPTHKSLWGSEKYLFLECINEYEALTAFWKKYIVFTRYHFLLFLPFTFFT